MAPEYKVAYQHLLEYTARTGDPALAMQRLGPSEQKALSEGSDTAGGNRDFILTIDVGKALWFTDSSGKGSFGIGIGTIVLAINVVLLGGYTFGCHSLRHLVGGFRDQFSAAPTCYQAYRCVTCLNRRHMLWAWLSLFWVGFSDLYVRLCSMGVWHDFRIL